MDILWRRATLAIDRRSSCRFTHARGSRGPRSGGRRLCSTGWGGAPAAGWSRRDLRCGQAELQQWVAKGSRAARLERRGRGEPELLLRVRLLGQEPRGLIGGALLCRSRTRRAGSSALTLATAVARAYAELVQFHADRKAARRCVCRTHSHGRAFVRTTRAGFGAPGRGQ